MAGKHEVLYCSLLSSLSAARGVEERNREVWQGRAHKIRAVNKESTGHKHV